MKIDAYAKINICLDVVGKRPDGYHDVDMIMQNISLCDSIAIEKTLSQIELGGTGLLSYDKANLAYRAAELFFDASGIKGGARIHIQKRIPLCAGLAGGSTDAAAILKGLNLLYGKPLTLPVLTKIGARLGADVPFCVLGKTARACGIGDKLTEISPLPCKSILIVKPTVAVSTPEAYAGLDFDNMDHPDIEKAICAIENGDMKSLYREMGNSFEYSIFRKHPEIANIKSKMLCYGADASLMSGSGSAVFGIFEDEDKLSQAYNIFKNEYADVFAAHTV